MDTGEKSFGKYVLLHKIAAGGMAVTYRARMAAAAGVTKDVVIKKIHPHLAEENDFVSMFIGEAQLTASLTHSNIAQVFDFGELNGEYFLAMEYVQGQALSRVLRRAADRDLPFLPGAVALQIAVKMCEGLHYAHTRKDQNGRLLGLVHRDVSPENTLINYEGEVKIIDFGIAKASRQGKQTETGLVKGKYPYFSPEQAQAQRDLDARSDVYAVGVVLFEMLCGRRPYEGEFVHVLAQITTGTIPKPSSINPGITPALEQVMLKALATNRDERYSSARELSQALSQLLHSRYPGATAADVGALLGTLFEAELQAEGLELPVPPAFRTALEKTRVPGYGEKRRAQLGLKPDVPKATPRTPARPSSISGSATPSPGMQSPPRAMKSSLANRVVQKPGASASESSSKKVPVTSARRPGMLAPEAEAQPEAKRSVSGKMAPVEDEPTPPPKPAARVIQPRGSAKLSLDTPELAKKRQKLVISIATPIIGVCAVIFLLVFIFSDKSGPKKDAPINPAYVWLATQPPGAAVTLDGQQIGVTPIDKPITSGLHTMVLTLKGYRPWTRRYTFKQFERFNETIKLEAIEPAIDQPVNPPPTDSADAGPTAATADGSSTKKRKDQSEEKWETQWPLRLFVLRVKPDTLPLADYPTATYDLKPGASYQASTDGSYELGKRRSSHVYYFLEGGSLPPKARFGVLGPSAITLKGATKLHVFMLDEHPEEAKGTLRINLRISQYVAPTGFTFDAEKNTFAMGKDQRFHLSGLNPTSEYLLTLRPDEPVMDDGKQGAVTEVFCQQLNKEPPLAPMSGNHFWEVGKSVHLMGATDLYCTFPDVTPDDNAGAVEVDIYDVADLSDEDLGKLGEKRKSH